MARVRDLFGWMARFDGRADLFQLQLRHCEKLYAIHYTPSGWRGQVGWYLYRAMYALIYLSYVHKSCWVLQNWTGNVASASNILGVLWFFSAVILRVAILEWHYPIRAQLQQTFLGDHSYRRGDPWTETRRAQFYRRSNRITLAVMAANFAEIVCFAAINVLTLEDFMLQFRGRIVGGWPLQILYGVLTMCWGGSYCVGFLICYLLMGAFELEINILLHSLEELGREVQGQADTDGAFWNGLIYKLRPHIQRLMELFEALQKLKVIINPIAFVQYYSTYLVIADCCLILATGSMLSGHSVVYIMSMLVFLAEAFLLCRGVERLRNLRPRIAEVLYDFEWTLKLHSSRGRSSDAQYRHVRHTFLLVTAHAGQMIRFSFAGIGEISMNSFSELLEKSYSMLTFLLHFAN